MRMFAVVLFLLVATTSRAHLTLESPASRYGGDVLKDGPCGRSGGARSANVTELASGATIEVVFDEYIDHPGHFRIAFDADGDDDFRDPPCLENCVSRTDPAPVFATYSDPTVLLDGIADTRGGRTTIQVTLPDVECERCTLQVIQVMYDKRPITSPGNDLYYQCADLVLRRATAPEADVVEEVPVVEVGPEVVIDQAPEAVIEEASAEPVTEVTTPIEDDGCGAGGALLGAWLGLAGVARSVARRARR